MGHLLSISTMTSLCLTSVLMYCMQSCIIMKEVNRNMINSLRLRQNDCHFADDTFKCFFLNENVLILIKISLEFISEGPINNIPALVQIRTWHWPGHKPLSELMIVRLQTHICITRPQWVNKGIITLLIFQCRNFLHKFNGKINFICYC